MLSLAALSRLRTHWLLGRSTLASELKFLISWSRKPGNPGSSGALMAGKTLAIYHRFKAQNLGRGGQPLPSQRWWIARWSPASAWKCPQRAPPCWGACSARGPPPNCMMEVVCCLKLLTDLQPSETPCNHVIRMRRTRKLHSPATGGQVDGKTPA